MVLSGMLFFLFYFFSLLFFKQRQILFHSPVDVVKTRIQLDPVKYNKGLIGGFKQVIAEEGAIGLATGLGPTVVGYFVQGTVVLILFLYMH
jgi:hypothetical protein